MGRQTKITVNLDALEQFKDQLGNRFYARVGIIGGKASEEHKQGGFNKNGKRIITSESSGMTNAEIGIIQEFGSETAGIPPRSFLRMPIEEKIKDLVRFLGSSAIQSMFEKKNIKGIFKAMGIEGEGIVQDAFATRGFGRWKPNAPSTIAAKGSDSPLIDTAQLRRAISSDVVGK